MKRQTFGQRQWLLVLLVVIGMAIFAAALMYVSYANVKGHPAPFFPIFLSQIAWWSPWVPLVPLIVRLASRYPVDRQTWLRSGLVHLAGSLFFSAVHLTLYVVVARAMGGFVWLQLAEKSNMGFFAVLFFILTSPFVVNFKMRLLLYTIIVMISHAVDYHQRYRKQELEASRLETQLAQAQLQALRMQLHPHFLFNTLHSVSALIYKDITAADEMIQKLISFLNLTLEDSGPQEVTLKKELEFLNNYLQIEQIRFQDRLVVDMQIQPETLEALVPNLIMQPIVENAIRHGIAPRSTPGHIEIRASRNNGILQIVVKDNGPGLATTAQESPFREGVGLSNTRLRLQQIYGNEYHLDLKNAQEGGVNVILEFPYHCEALA